jgi:predicted short-subunit dehydrogenase-like oxidoreductase (DUF2520 family)
LTGPVRRGDAGTVRKNLQAIAAVDPRALELYRMLAARSLELVKDSYADQAKLGKIRRLLGG